VPGWGKGAKDDLTKGLLIKRVRSTCHFGEDVKRPVGELVNDELLGKINCVCEKMIKGVGERIGMRKRLKDLGHKSVETGSGKERQGGEKTPRKQLCRRWDSR